MIQHLILTPGQEPEARTAALDYDAIVAMVGYPIEVINIDGGRAVMYACEEQNGQPKNEAANQIAADSLRDDDYIVGTVVIVGPLGAGGVDTSLPNDTLTELLERIQR